MSVLATAIEPEVGRLLDGSLAGLGISETANGLRVIAIERLEWPVADLTFVALAGGLHDPPGRAGLAALVPAALLEATGEEGRERRRRLEAIGTSLAPHVDWRSTSISVSCLSDDLDTGLDLLFDVVGTARFTDRGVEAVRGSAIARLRRREVVPEEMAERLLERTLFANGPYGRPLFGEPSSVSCVGRPDFEAFHRDHYRAGGAMVVVVGCFDAGRLLAGIEERAGGLVAGVPPVPPLPTPPAAAPRLVLGDLPGAGHSALCAGHPSLAQGHPEVDRLWLLALILGGETSGRLNRRLREELGYTYGLRVAVRPRPGCGLLLASGSVRTDRAGETVEILREEIERLRRDPVAFDELERVRRRTAGRLLRSLQTSRDLVPQVIRLAALGFPADYFARTLRRLEETTPGDLLELARQHLRPDRLTVAAVGPAAELRPRLEAVGVAAPEAASRADSRSSISARDGTVRTKQSQNERR